MSLLNQMLQDLDRRDAPAALRGRLASHVRALPGEFTPSRRRDLVLILGGLLIGSVLVWLSVDFPVFRGRAPTPVQIPSPPIGPAPAPVVISAPDGPTGTALPSMDSLKIDPDLSAVVDSLPPPQPKPSRLGPAMAEPSSPPVVPRSARAHDGAGSPLPLAAQSQIDKTSRGVPVSEAAEGEYRKALAMVRRGSLAEGADGLRRTLQLEGRHSQARQALLSVLVEQRQWREALAVSSEGLTLDPTHSEWAMLAARLLVEQGDLARAADLLGTHAAQGEKNADYLAFYGLLLHKLQRSKEAVQRYQAAVTLRPAEGRWWYGLGMALEADHRETEAREAYRRAREVGSLTSDMAGQVEQKLR